MNRDDVIRMAREAHVVPYIIGPTNDEYLGRLERLVQAAYAAGAAAEREACAKVCDSFAESEKPSELWTTCMGVAYKNSAAAIRARGQA